MNGSRQGGGRLSKTARKFTGYFGSDELPHAVSVNLDWLSLMVDCGLKEPAPDAEAIFINDGWILEYQKKGNQMFSHMYKCYYAGEHVANMFTHSRNEKMLEAGAAKIEIMNQVLYSTSTLQVLGELMQVTGCTRIRNISRIDISIDGCNHVHGFLNAYYRQRDNRPYDDLGLIKLGRWDNYNRVKLKGKARFDAKVFNRKTGMFDAFKIGGAKKTFVLYNKTSELEHSHKEYIRKAWEKAGIDTTQTVWRCELRMNSEAIKSFAAFELERITDPNYLLQLYKTSCENFFQFIFVETDSNVSRARVIDLFQFEKLKVPLLETIPRAIVRGAYKAKMAIHNAFANLLIGVVKDVDSMKASIQHIADNINLYNLQRWYDNHKEQWLNLYAPVPIYNSVT